MSQDYDDMDGCSRCEGSLYYITREGEFATAARCTCRDRCPDCAGHRVVTSLQDGLLTASPCKCRELDTRILLYNRARIPARFANTWIEDFDDSHASQKEMKYALLKHRDTFTPGEPGLLLWGEPGVGKTHLLCGLVGYLAIERGLSCRFIDIMRLIMDLKKAYAEGRWDSEVISPLLEVDVLVIDELGKGKNSEFELDILDQLISSRYNAGRTIHCTSNYRLESGPPGVDGTGQGHPGALPTNLRARIGDRIFSRLHEMCRLFHLEGEDYRKRGFGRRRRS